MTKVDIYSKKRAQLMGDGQKDKILDFIRSAPRTIARQTFLDILSLPASKDFVILLGKDPDETLEKIDRLLELTA